jgi:hypothetical protein
MPGFNNNFMDMAGQAVALAAAQTDNLEINSSIVTVTPQTTGDVITGAVPPGGGAGVVIIVNIDPAKNLVLANNHIGSTAAFRFINTAGADLTVPPGYTAAYAYVPGFGWAQISLL